MPKYGIDPRRTFSQRKLGPLEFASKVFATRLDVVLLNEIIPGPLWKIEVKNQPILFLADYG